MKAKCPRCKTESEYSSDNPYRPFCSQRCRDIDLGAWLTGKNAIAGESLPTLASDDDSYDDGENEGRKH